MSSRLLEVLAEAVADGGIADSALSLDEVPAAFNPAPPQPVSGKSVIVMSAR
jgi:hypothetical protein